MLKKTIKYTDFNEKPQEEDHYFHLSKTELIEMALGEGHKDGDLAAALQALADSDNAAEQLAMFAKIVGQSYGKRSEDGKKFEKSPEMLAEFKSSPAYDALFFELCTDGAANAEFILGILPKEIREAAEVQTVLKDVPQSGKKTKTTTVTRTEKPWAHREPTAKELKSMSRADLLEVMQRKSTS